MCPLTSIPRLVTGNSSGASAAEFALVLPLFVLLITGTIDFGGLMYKKLQVGSAANAGASYALVRGFSANGISTAIRGGTTLAVTAPTPTQTCGCPSAGTGITAAVCGSTCPAGGAAGKYVTISVSADHELLFQWPGLDDTMTITTTAKVRIP